MKRRFMHIGFIRVIVVAALAMTASQLLAQKLETGFLDQAVVVNKTEYRYQVYVPREYSRS